MKPTNRFVYHSVQSYSHFNNGKWNTKVNRVDINGPRGTKSVKKGKRMTKKRLTRKEVNCIRRCQFIPGLFKDCENCFR
jgi:hypothetical protein